MSYNGDGSPSFVSGETADHVTFYRLDAGTRTEVFHYPYNSSTVNFNSVPTVGGTSLVKTSDTIAQASNAGTLDNLDSTQFLRSDTSDTMTAGRLSFHTSNVQAPTSSNATTGARLNLYPLGSGRDYSIGIENSHMWFNTDGGYKFYEDGSIRVTFSSGGNITATGDVTAFSDKRLKTNIKTLDGKKALQMRGVSFEKNGGQGSGVIAQELEKIAPELVHTSNDDMQTKSVAYGNLVGYLIEAIKTQQEQIDELKQQVQDLGNQK